MRPEDLGIKGFTPEPVPPRPSPNPIPRTAGRQRCQMDPQPDINLANTRAVVAAAENATQKVRALVETADAIERQHAALKGAYDRSQATVQRAAAELFHLKRALEEVKRHRLVLFVAGLVLLAIALLAR
jgi:hypothetical protein